MEYSIKILKEHFLVGKSVSMSILENKTQMLWKQFMPKRRKIKNVISDDFFSVEVYPNDYFDAFIPTKTFKKWAAVKVENFKNQPEEFEQLYIPEGKYAVFTYKGKSSEAYKCYQYIYGEWLSVSGNSLDNRPHFAVMGEKYKNDDPTSEEEIWIPIK
ncbi:GyrI-like domain-containing protein [Joostella sp. CR20]|uniref:GyrI-like domain-containing protein n=1 Tax=Joostella sp. CR20 TaxID=2804312 RepID=UPI00313D04AC